MRGRRRSGAGCGDVVHEGCAARRRSRGATAAATLLAGTLAPGSHLTVALMLGLLTVATWLRAASYAWWVVAVTGVVALLQDFYGSSSVHVLLLRLAGFGLGCVVRTHSPPAGGPPLRAALVELDAVLAPVAH